jgi:hypothetical protein
MALASFGLIAWPDGVERGSSRSHQRDEAVRDGREERIGAQRASSPEGSPRSPAARALPFGSPRLRAATRAGLRPRAPGLRASRIRTAASAELGLAGAEERPLRWLAPRHGARLAVLLRYLFDGPRGRIGSEHAGGLGARSIERAPDGSDGSRRRSRCTAPAAVRPARRYGSSSSCDEAGDGRTRTTCTSSSSRSAGYAIRTSMLRWIAGALHGKRVLLAPRWRVRVTVGYAAFRCAR